MEIKKQQALKIAGAFIIAFGVLWLSAEDATDKYTLAFWLLKLIGFPILILGGYLIRRAEVSDKNLKDIEI